ncbi:MAG: STAS/SEC14 domain-containing protein [Planctomycetota bacterium]
MLDETAKNHSQATPIIEVNVSGKLEKADYEALIPVFEKEIEEHGKLRLLVLLDDFEGWSASALWEDIQFDVKHFRDFEKLAIVGDSKWHEGMSVFCRPFTTAEIRYFDIADAGAAHQWIRAD